MAFGPKAGCPMCGIVAAAGDALQSARDSYARPEILWRDDNFTAYREQVHPVSSKAHVIIAFNLHVPSLYTLSSSDLPLLVNIRNLAQRLLASPLNGLSQQNNSQFHIGFIAPPFRDNKIPVSDHLHAHAYIAPADQLGWWRGVAYGPLAWYAVDDLIAEIRYVNRSFHVHRPLDNLRSSESVSNNRVKSGYEKRKKAPIDSIPEAGAANGYEFNIPSLVVSDVEGSDNEGSPRPSTP
ncbi:hypothetical protein J3R83DRAFT_6831 [Lanmaoa asiatica]|nr:hypothetical protein J3R83DRAFT_6831 [Lanmaoa asiatica]